jgi:hypothetical protein
MPTVLSDSIAWKINFNLSLTTFKDCISGVRVLVDFAITSPLMRPPHLLLVSSIAVFNSAYCPKNPYFLLITQSRFREQGSSCGGRAIES